MTTDQLPPELKGPRCRECKEPRHPGIPCDSRWKVIAEAHKLVAQLHDERDHMRTVAAGEHTQGLTYARGVADGYGEAARRVMDYTTKMAGLLYPPDSSGVTGGV